MIEDQYIDLAILERQIKHPIEWMPASWAIESLSDYEVKKWSVIICDCVGTSHRDIYSFFLNLDHPNKILTSAIEPLIAASNEKILDNFVLKENLAQVVKERMNR